MFLQKIYEFHKMTGLVICFLNFLSEFFDVVEIRYAPTEPTSNRPVEILGLTGEKPAKTGKNR
jgi:hypothetical protein